jgi:hypothetical protein
LFSATGNGCAGAATAEGAEVTGLCAADLDPPLHAVASSATASVTATPTALRFRIIMTWLTGPHHGIAGARPDMTVRQYLDNIVVYSQLVG